MAAADELPTAVKHDKLRLVAAMLKQDADCTRILSRDCQEIDVDPRIPFVVRVSAQETEIHLGNLLQTLATGEGRDSMCRYYRFYTCKRVWMYDVAALTGNIKALSTLPALYDDISPRDQSSHAHIGPAQPPEVAVEPDTSVSERSPLSADRGDLQLHAVDGGQTSADSREIVSFRSSENDVAGVEQSQPASTAKIPEVSLDTSENITFTDSRTAVSGEISSRCVSSEELSNITLNTDTSQSVSVKNPYEDPPQSDILTGMTCEASQSHNVYGQELAQAVLISPESGHSRGGNVQCEVAMVEEEEQNTFFDSYDTVPKPQDHLISDGEEEDTFFDAVETLLHERGAGTDSLQMHIHDDQVAAAATKPSEIKYAKGEDHDETLMDSLDMLLHVEEESTTLTPPEKVLQGTVDEDAPMDSLGALFHSIDADISELPSSPYSDHVSESSPVARTSPQPPPGAETAVAPSRQAQAWCRHTDRDKETCFKRREIVQSAVRRYTQGYSENPLFLEDLVGVLRDQPCSEDAICVFETLSALPVAKDGSLDLLPLVAQYGHCKGFHSGKTPVMVACCHANEALLQMLLMDGAADVECRDRNDITALQHLYSCFTEDNEVRKRMARALRLHGAQGASVPGPAWCHREDALSVTFHQSLPGQDCQRDAEDFVRKKQSKLCELAWQLSQENEKELKSLTTLFDVEISFRCCTFTCPAVLFPDLAISHSGCDPPVLFHSDLSDNEELLVAVEWGECPCKRTSEHKGPVSFLPACAAAVAGNMELFRRMLTRFAERVRGDRRQREGKCGSRKSALKNSYGATGGCKKRKVLLDTSMAAFHGERLLAQALRHLLYAGHAREALRTLDDPLVQDALALTEGSKMSLLDLSLRLGDHDTFLEMLDRFGLDIRSDSDGLTPLLLAVSWGLVELSRTLLRRGARRGVTDWRGLDALRIAFRSESTEGSDEMALMLLEEGEGHCDPDDPAVPSALQSAITHRRHAVLDYLLQRGHMRVPERVRHTKKSLKLGEYVLWSPVVAWCSVRSHQPTMACYLVEKGLDCLTPVPRTVGFGDSDTRTPLQACVAETSPESLRLLDLLIENGADVNGRTVHGHAPLVIAMKSGNVKVLPALLYAGAVLDPLDSVEGGPGESGLSQNGSFLWHALNTKKYRVAEMAVAGGYRARREDWYVKGDFPVRTPPEVVQALERVVQQPLSLLTACRRRLRSCLGSGLPAYLAQAALPTAVEDYIRMKDLVETYLQ